MARRAAFDPATDEPLLNCAPKGMPGIMSNPYPFEFHDRGDVIELRLEEYDTVRSIYMNAETAPAPTPSILGHSIGHWEGDSLVVETTHVNWGHMAGRGILLSDDLHQIERFFVKRAVFEPPVMHCLRVGLERDRRGQRGHESENDRPEQHPETGFAFNVHACPLHRFLDEERRRASSRGGGCCRQRIGRCEAFPLRVPDGAACPRPSRSEGTIETTHPRCRAC